jgi:hypothetical protein
MLLQIINGIRRHPWRFIISIPLSLAVFWGIAEPFATTYQQILGIPLLIILAACALVVSLVKAWSPSKISIRWNALSLSVIVKAGDLFSEEYNIAITADDFFLTQSSKLVNERSLIGQLVQRRYLEQAVALDVDIERALAGMSEVSLEVGEIPGNKKR